MNTASAYLDYQSSTPVLPEVMEAMAPYWTEVFGTPSSLHQQGLRTRDALARAREQVAAFLHAASPEEIIFTSGGTEAANLAIKGVAYASRRRGNHIVLSAIEHPSVTRSVAFLEEQGFTATRVSVDGEGRVTAASVRDAMTDQTILVCVHHANHDIGTIEPIREIASVVAERGVPLFVDAVASAGWLDLDVSALGAGLVSLSPHRFYGPKGVGVLYRHRRARLASIQHGGMQEEDRRAGTENVGAIVGAGVAAEIASRDGETRRSHVMRLQGRLWDGLRATVRHMRLNGPEPGPGRLPTNLNLSVAHVEGEGLALMCDVQGIAVSSGASCVSRTLKVSPVLEAIGLERSLAQSNVILSLGKDNTDGEIDYFLGKFPGIVDKLRAMSPSWEPDAP
jgi:cysteine desulfurase